MAFDDDGCLLGSNSVARQLVPRPAQPPGMNQPTHSQELLALPWAHLVEHARRRPDALMQLPLWSGLRLQALVQPAAAASAPTDRGGSDTRRHVFCPSIAAAHQRTSADTAGPARSTGHVSQAAKRLGLSRATLYRRLGNKRNGSAR